MRKERKRSPGWGKSGFKKAICFILCLLIIFSGMPLNVFAEEKTSSDELLSEENSASNTEESKIKRQENANESDNTESSALNNVTEDSKGQIPSLTSDDEALRTTPQEFPFDDHLLKLDITVADSHGTRVISYDAKDPKPMEFGEVDRDAALLINLLFNVNDVTGNNTISNNNPTIFGDTFTCHMPEYLSNSVNGVWSGRLKDDTTNWGKLNGTIGDFRIENGIMTITFDQEYIEETQGNIKDTNLEFNGTFDSYGWQEEEWKTTLLFGSVDMNITFPPITNLRNLSITKEVETIPEGTYNYSTSNSAAQSGMRGMNSLNGTAATDNDYLKYTLRVKAANDNTTVLQNVIVGDTFTSDNVDLDSIVLDQVLKGLGNEDITAQAIAQKDANGHITGWNIGALERGEEAVLTFRIKVDKEALTEAVDAAKQADPNTTAEAARMVENTGRVSADKTPEATDDCATILQNALTVSKTKDGAYDPINGRQYFTITITAPQENKYTQKDVYIKDRQDTYKNWYKDQGIESITITHADGTVTTSSQSNPLYHDFVLTDNKSNSKSDCWWEAYLDELAPGDIATIKTYVDIDLDRYYQEPGGTNGTNGPSVVYNYVYSGNGPYSMDLGSSQMYCSYTLTKNWISKSGSYSSDGTVTWTMVGNRYDSDVPNANIEGMLVQDILGDHQIMADSEVYVTFYEKSVNNSQKVLKYTGPGSNAQGQLVVPTTANGFSFVIPEGYGEGWYRVIFKTTVDNNYGPSYSYKNEGKLGIWTYNGSTTRPRIATMNKYLVTKGEDWAEWRSELYGNISNGDYFVDKVANSRYMFMTDDQINSVSLTFNGKELDPSLYEITKTAVGTSDVNSGFTIMFKGEISDVAGGKTIYPTAANPLNIVYRMSLSYPTYTSYTQYSNTGELYKNGEGMVDSATNYFYRSNYNETEKTYEQTIGSSIYWKVKVNRYGFGCYQLDSNGLPVLYNSPAGYTNDNVTILTEQIPAGQKFVSVAYTGEKGSSANVPDVEVLSETINPDGSSTVKIKVSKLRHYEVSPSGGYTSSTSYNMNMWVMLRIVTQITDKECLEDTTNKRFTFTNTVEETHRDNPNSQSTANMNISHVSMTKEMAYNAATAPNASFTINFNEDAFDLNPDGDTVKFYDAGCSALQVDTDSIKVINTYTGLPVNYTLDGVKLSEGIFGLIVPDNLPLKITYLAYVAGARGDKVNLQNTAYFEGQITEQVTSKVNENVTVIGSSASSQSDIMIWMKKMDSTGQKLAGALFTLTAFDPVTDSWVVVQDDIPSVNTGYATKISHLQHDVLYCLTEKEAPLDFVTDATPHYFALKQNTDSIVAMPAGFDESKVFYCKVAALMNIYNKPYVTVNVKKVNKDDLMLAGAEFKLLNENNEVVKDRNGKEIVFTTEKTAVSTFKVPAGNYTLVETKAPDGYYPIAPIRFMATGDKTVTMGGKTLADNLISVLDDKTVVRFQKLGISHDDNGGEIAAPLSGCHFVVRDTASDVVVYEFDSTTDIVEVEGVFSVGRSYTVQETVTPVQYFKSADFTFTVNDDHTITTSQDVGQNGQIVINNVRPSLTFLKIASNTNQPLVGAEMQLLDGNDVVFTWTTGSKAQTIYNLERGKVYTVHEASAPRFYQAIADFTMTILDDRTVTVEQGSPVIQEASVFKITDQYVPEPCSVSLDVTKAFTAASHERPIKQNFTFRLIANTANAPMPANNTKELVINDTGTAAFDDITFDKVGTYIYTVEEVNDGLPNYVYAGSKTVQINVVDNAGILTPTVTVNGQSTTSLTFVNSYIPTPVSIDLPVMKTFSQDSVERPIKRTFTFTLEAVTSGAPMPAVATVTTLDEATTTIRNLSFTRAGVYTYTLTESNDGNNGYTYAAPKTVEITVEDVNGSLVVTNQTIGGLILTTATFENSYRVTPVTQVINLQKRFSVDSQIRPQEEEFTFTISAVTQDAPLPDDGVLTKAITGVGDNAFDQITFTKAGTYIYTISENNNASDGYIYDGSKQLVIVIKDIDSVLTVDSVMIDHQATDTVVFTNTYIPNPVSLDIPVQKLFTPDSHVRPVLQYFTFNLKALGQSPLPISGNTSIRVADLGVEAFDSIRFTEAGKYLYEIQEEDGGLTGYTYAISQPVEITVEDIGGNLVITSVTIDGVEARAASFINRYVPKPAHLMIPVSKSFSSSSDERSILETFTFVLSSVGSEGGDTETPMPENGGDIITIKDVGQSVFGTISYTGPGVYTYVISEKDDHKEGYTYAKERIVVVTVYDEEGELHVSFTVDGEKADRVEFVNSYAAPQISSSTAGGPKTGENINIVLWSILLILSIILFGVVLLVRRKKEDDR